MDPKQSPALVPAPVVEIPAAAETENDCKCEFRSYRHVKKKDGTSVKEVTNEHFNVEHGDTAVKDAGYAIVIHRKFNDKKELEYTRVNINSPVLLKVFREVVGSYPSLSPDFLKPFKMYSPYQMLMHYWDELDTHRTSTSDADERMHLNLLFDFMEQELGAERAIFVEMLRQERVNFDSVWGIYRPGDLLYTEYKGQPWLVRCVKTAYEESHQRGKLVEVHCVYTDDDGTKTGRSKHLVCLYQKERFPGRNDAAITSLPIYPLKYAKNNQDLKERLIARGNRFLALQNGSIMKYKGTAEYLREPDATVYDPNMGSWGAVWLPYTETGRLVLDRKTFEEDYWYALNITFDSPEVDPMLCPPYTIGYSVARNEWCRVLVDNLGDPGWKEDVWEALILPRKDKLVLKALVTSHQYPDNSRDQPEQKGKGLVVLLHGSPGSGKTMTAETAAEGSQRVLISSSMSDLNKWNRLSSFQIALQNLLRQASTWKAIVLLDEADVFLETRDDNQTERNSLVAVFLRELEYFGGVVFLTTNRVESFDPAMKSRIHLSLAYQPPGAQVRLELWTKLIGALPEEELAVDSADIKSLLEYNLNGREIANIINTSRTVARYQKETLQISHIRAILDVRLSFEASLAHVRSVTIEDGKPPQIIKRPTMGDI